jgi:hypothetical protein
MDAERSAVYGAELAAFDGTDLETVVGVERLGARLRAVVAGEWWPGPLIDVRAARADARSSTTRCATVPSGGRAVIRFAATQATVATAAHELAHALAGADAGHGPIFRTAYLDVIGVITNLDTTDRRHTLHVDQLATAFDEAGLMVGERRWPPPPPSATGAIAL